MKKYIYIIWMLVVVIITGATFIGCSDDDDFPNKPQAINIEQDIVLTPIYGGVEVEWTPNPADTNFVFLHIEFENQDGMICSYNVSRYNSSLVKDEEANEAASVTITNLVNQEYTLHFSAFNNENKNIDLGMRKVTPLDYKLGEPDSIFAVTAVGGLEYKIRLEWREVPYKSGTATKGVRFLFTNREDPSVQFSKDFDLGIKHAEFVVDKKYKGEYNMTYGTYSETGKEFKKDFTELVLVGLPATVEYWSKSSRKDWMIEGCSDIDEGDGGGHFADMLDGDPTTYWHSSWDGGDTHEGLHYFQVDIKKPLSIEQCLFQQRNVANRQSAHATIFISEDGEDWGDAVYDGPLTLYPSGTPEKEAVKFTPKAGRYIFVYLSEYTSQAGGEDPFACMAEFGIVAREIITEE
nr:discoidin domain-containing protein [uncultured Bacteroides sp.]